MNRIAVNLLVSRCVIQHGRRPQDPEVLHDPEHVLDAVGDLPVDVVSAGLRTRPVPTDEGERSALDTVVVLRRR